MSRTIRFAFVATAMTALFLFIPAANAATTPSPVLVYAEQPEGKPMLVYLKVGNGDPEQLATIDPAPSKLVTRLSYSKKLLAINLGTSILIFDFKKKTSSTVLTATDGQFDFLTPPTAGVAISPDDRYLLAIERTTTAPDTPTLDDQGQPINEPVTTTKYRLSYHLVDLRTGETTVIKEETTDRTLVPRFWRSDGNVLALTGGGGIRLFDVKTQRLSVPRLTQVGLFSGDGLAMAKVWSTKTKNDCNQTVQNLGLFDFKTGQRLGSVASPVSSTKPIAVSPNKKAILFYGIDKCAKTAKTSFYIANLETGENTEVDDYLAVMRQYDAWSIGAHDQTTSKGYVITIGEKTVVTSENPLTILAQFWQQASPSLGKGKDLRELFTSESTKRLQAISWLRLVKKL